MNTRKLSSTFLLICTMLINASAHAACDPGYDEKAFADGKKFCDCQYQGLDEDTKKQKCPRGGWYGMP